MAFGIFRVFAVEAGVKQPKIFFFTWAGESAPLKRKVAANAIKTHVLDYFSPVSASMQVSSLSELSEAEVIKRLDAARGSHKPARYEFGTGKDEDEEDDERESRESVQKAAADEVARLAKIAAEEAAAKKAEEDRLAEEEAARVAAIEQARKEAERIAAEGESQSPS
jgi:hypothetical protein